jgi:hypothetical protein
MPASRNHSFEDALRADGPAPESAGKLALYGRFVGDWTLDATMHEADGSVRHGTGEVHFAWVLQGRAIQDVWTVWDVFYGTTLRVYDPKLDAWRILWNDPVLQIFARQIGRADGDEILQEGASEDGVPLRWRFSEITARSFRWRGERSDDGGKTWWLQHEYRATRAEGG